MGACIGITLVIIFARWMFVKFILKEDKNASETFVSDGTEECYSEKQMQDLDYTINEPLTLIRMTEYLRKNGYTIETEDAVISFKYEGDWYYIIFDEKEDADYVTIGKYYYSFERTPDINISHARMAAEFACMRLKTVKMFCDDTQIYLKIEAFYESMAQFTNFFRRNMDILQATDHAFQEHYRKLTCDTPSVINEICTLCENKNHREIIN